MKTKAFVKSDTVAIKDVSLAGFQPDLIYIGTGGIMVVHTTAGDDVQVNVYDGQWWPASNVVRVNATTTTASGFVAWQS
jgi:hypothetical protein